MFNINNAPLLPIFENVKFSDLFTEWKKADIKITKQGIKHAYPEIARSSENPSYIQCWLTFSGHTQDSLDVLPSKELVEWIDSNMLSIDYDRIYFEIISREDGYFLRANYNLIIGSRLLAIFPITETFEMEDS